MTRLAMLTFAAAVSVGVALPFADRVLTKTAHTALTAEDCKTSCVMMMGVGR